MLATPRTDGIATLSPGVTENSTNSGQMVVNGAMAFDHIFMINGVDLNDNLFAQPQTLFIEVDFAPGFNLTNYPADLAFSILRSPCTS